MNLMMIWDSVSLTKKQIHTVAKNSIQNKHSELILKTAHYIYILFEKRHHSTQELFWQKGTYVLIKVGSCTLKAVFLGTNKTLIQEILC